MKRRQAKKIIKIWYDRIRECVPHPYSRQQITKATNNILRGDSALVPLFDRTPFNAYVTLTTFGRNGGRILVQRVDYSDCDCTTAYHDNYGNPVGHY